MVVAEGEQRRQVTVEVESCAYRNNERVGASPT